MIRVRILEARYQIPDTGYQIPDTRYRIPDTRWLIITKDLLNSQTVSSILYPESCIRHPESCIRHPESCIRHPESSIQYQSLKINLTSLSLPPNKFFFFEEKLVENIIPAFINLHRCSWFPGSSTRPPHYSSIHP